MFNSKLYLTWTEGQCFLGGATCQIRVKVYNGNDASPSWNSADGGAGLNIDLAKTAALPTLVSFNSKLYLGWSEVNGTGASQVHMKVYNGNDSAAAWTLVDGNSNGLNVLLNAQSTGQPSFAVLNSQLYGFWEEVPVAGTIYNFQAKVYNGNDSSPSWSFLDNTSAPLNCQDGREGSSGQLTSFNGELYAGWSQQCPLAEGVRFAKHLR